MTRWKPNQSRFTVKVTKDNKGSMICRIPKPVLEWLDNPKSISFHLLERMCAITRADPTLDNKTVKA